jgi:enterochelin esterase-like enzyme
MGLVTARFDYDGGRQVTTYLPTAPPQVVVFGGDGQLISTWGPSLEASNAPPTMIVGVHRTDDSDEMVRLREYSPGFDPERLSAHEHFFVHDVREWVRAKFDMAIPASRTTVAGVSASAEFALAMGLRHPDLFGAVSASPGAGYRPPSAMPGILPRVYLTAGTLEPFFLDTATRWAEALRTAGAAVQFSEQVGDHGDPFWQAEFVKMVNWAVANH